MRLVVFDMDGTLVDSHAYITDTIAAAFAALDLPLPTAEQSRQIIGLSLPVALGQLSGLEGGPLDDLLARYRQMFHASPPSGDHEPLFDGIADALQTLHADPQTLLGIATGKGQRGVDRILNLHGLADFFATSQTPDTNPSKPHPQMLYSAGQETGIPMQRTLMIGDTTFDMEMARAAGALAIGVSWGYHEVSDLRRAGAHIVLDNAGELVGAIDELVKSNA